MSNFRLNLPIDIPWKLVNCSEDMMDKTFCDKKMPSPFRSSISLYTYDPKVEDIPEEYSKCGKQITYLKVSCSITGYQPTEEEKQQIIDLLASVKGVDYSKIDDIIREYFGCYGVLLNVSVHPDKKNKDDLDKYPHIIDFEPKVRDFYQAASETGEILTSSIGRLTTNKSYGTTDSTQSSWNAGSEVSSGIGITDPSSGVGGNIGTKTNANTGQVRTETDQSNWGITTDASRERREGQSTTTQLSQMYNLLTGYHSGTNRASFVMLPRPHILQPTDRRTFVQGLRVIEGVQDFFLIVIRDKEQPILNVDAFLQTGHFPENINIPSPADDVKYEYMDSIYPVEYWITGKGRNPIWDGNKKKNMEIDLDVVDESNGWEADPTKGDSGKGGVKEIKNKETVTITEVDTETGDVLGTHQQTVSRESGDISDTDYKVTEGHLIVTAHLEATPDYGIFGGYGITTFSRAYQVFMRRKKTNVPTPVADVSGLLITQRKLCTQITYNECISSKDVTTIKLKPIDTDVVDWPGRWFDDIVVELPFDITPLFDIPEVVDPSIFGDKVRPPKPRGQRNDFPFKKGIIRMIQNSMLSASNSPLRNEPGTVGYLQSKHFQKRLLQILPKEVLESSIHDLAFINSKVKDKVSKNISLKEILSANDLLASKQFGISKNEILNVKKPDISK